MILDKKKTSYLAQKKLAKEAKDLGFSHLSGEQIAYLEDFWVHSAIRLEGDLLLQQGLNFCSYHILQSAGRDCLSSVSAKGLSGEG